MQGQREHQGLIPMRLLFHIYKMVEGEAASDTYSCGYFFKNNLASFTKHSSKV